MGFLDPWGDGVSVISGGFAKPSSHRRSSSHHHHHHSKDKDAHHHSSSKEKDHHHKHKDHRHKKKHSRSRSRSRSSSRHRSRSFAGTLFGIGNDSNYQKHNSSKTSFFGLPLGNASRSGFFGGGGGHHNRSSSYYKRSPRQGFMHRAYKRLKHLLRDLVHYAKRHPLKVFFLVVMPLITTGALAGLLARFGLRIPPGLERMMGMASKAASGDSIGLMTDAVRMAGDFGGSRSVKIERGRDGDMQWERRSDRVSEDGWGNGIMGFAKMFG